MTLDNKHYCAGCAECSPASEGKTTLDKQIEEMLAKPVNFLGLPIGDMVLSNGEMLREIPEFVEALTEIASQAREEERARWENIKWI